MEIRPALFADIRSIVDLLRISLGESLTPKSENYWRWKHIDNPFGPSPVLLAIENSELVGIRAFMRWTWAANDRIIQSVRAVDTATHPAFQGKGIFSKLTLNLLDTCRKDGIDIVFNTPNEKSRPGYLKMGWAEAGRLPVKIRVLRPLSIASSIIHNRKTTAVYRTSNEETNYFLNHPGLRRLLELNAQNASAYQTMYSAEFLRWRYSHVPVAEYRIGAIGNDAEIRGLFVYRLKSSRYGIEFRLADIFACDAISRKELAPAIIRRAKLERADYITQDALTIPVLSDPFCVKTVEGSPMVTVRDISAPKANEFIGFKNWAPSLGDLELF